MIRPEDRQMRAGPTDVPDESRGKSLGQFRIDHRLDQEGFIYRICDQDVGGAPDWVKASGSRGRQGSVPRSETMSAEDDATLPVV